ncbi:hypothetical protein [uncultured Desulfosarcina sp.]|uniref:hypothetical protein n=1 Tax=uncultured Desulfosarcina sp. TaxID=218289 RepID=UPI0029C6A737|nr:hypothetical protein [uncultured Desulfosarcina sp.]
MGAGKTSWAVQMMNDQKNSGKRYLYITPFLSEVQRIIDDCPGREFVEPKDGAGSKNKSDALKLLLADGRNIASTHELFKRLDDTTLDLIRIRGYTLVMDEVMDVVEPLKLKPEKVAAMFNREVLRLQTVKDYDGSFFRVRAGQEEAFDEFAEYQRMAEMGRLVLVNGTLLMWLFPSPIFSAFREIYNLTYLFDGQIQKAYFDRFNLNYEYFTVAGSRDAGYRLIPHERGRTAEADRIAEFRKLVTIHDSDKLNGTGKADSSLSATWFTMRACKADKQKLKKSVYTFFRWHAKGKSGENMWTTFKNQKQSLSGNGYARGFVPCTARATNMYRDRSNLAYCCNRYVHPFVKDFLNGDGFSIDEDLFALSEMIQWIWRSRVRDGKPINVFIPSARMRGLLISWLEGHWNGKPAD